MRSRLRSLAALSLVAAGIQLLPASVSPIAVPKAEAAHMEGFGCHAIPSTGATQYSVYVDCWLHIQRPANDTGANPLRLQVYWPKQWLGITPQWSAPGYTCNIDYNTVHSGLWKMMQCDGSTPLGGATQVDFTFHVEGACGTNWQSHVYLQNPYGVTVGPSVAHIQIPDCPTQAAPSSSSSSSSVSSRAPVVHTPGTPAPGIRAELSKDGVTFLSDLIGANAVAPGQIITARVQYDNRGTAAGLAAAVKSLFPAGLGFEMIPGTTKNCIIPVAGERVCDTDPEQAGPLRENALWRSVIEMVASPTAGLYDVDPGQTSGVLEMGKKRYLNFANCDYALTSGWNTDDNFYFAPGNTPRTVSPCGPGQPGPGGTIFRPGQSYVNVGDLVGRRYVNAQNCDFMLSNGLNTDDDLFFEPGNVRLGMTCNQQPGPNVVFRAGQSARFVMDHLGLRYLNFLNCDYGLVQGENTDDVISFNPSNTPLTSLPCGQGGGGTVLRPVQSVFDPLDLLDINRGRGYFEFRMRVTTVPGLYTQNVMLTGSNFPMVTDTALIEVPGPTGTDLSVVKTPLQTSVLRGGQITYQITATNNGPATTAAEVRDTVPAGLAFVASASSAACQLSGDTITCAAGTLTNGQSKTFTLRFNVPLVGSCTPATIHNTATVHVLTSGITDTVQSNNASVSIPVSVTCPTIPQCSDGLDNDGDGLIDYFDPGCYPNGVFDSISYNPNDNSEGGDTVFGCIEVTKEIFTSQGQQITPVPQFRFTLDGRSPRLNNSTGRFTYWNVVPGIHTVAEVIPPGWTAMSITPAGGVVNVQSGNACAQVRFQNRQLVP